MTWKRSVVRIYYSPPKVQTKRESWPKASSFFVLCASRAQPRFLWAFCTYLRLRRGCLGSLSTGSGEGQKVSRPSPFGGPSLRLEGLETLCKKPVFTGFYEKPFVLFARRVVGGFKLLDLGRPGVLPCTLLSCRSCSIHANSGELEGRK